LNHVLIVLCDFTLLTTMTIMCMPNYEPDDYDVPAKCGCDTLTVTVMPVVSVTLTSSWQF